MFFDIAKVGHYCELVMENINIEVFDYCISGSCSKTCTRIRIDIGFAIGRENLRPNAVKKSHLFLKIM
jgi:hypothetical protein